MLDLLLRAWLHHAAKEQIYGAIHEEFSRQSQHRENAAAGLPPRCDVGVVFNEESELVGLLDVVEGAVRVDAAGKKFWTGGLAGRGVVLAAAGRGADRVRAITAAVRDGHRPAWIIRAGFAQALQANLKSGDVVLAHDGAQSPDQQFQPSFLADASRGGSTNKSRVHVGKLLDVDATALAPAKREQLGAEHDALATMPAATAAADVCPPQQVGHLTLGVIAWGLRDAPPKELANVRRQKSAAGQLGAIIGGLLDRPGATQKLLQQHQASLLAADSLARVLKAIIAVLPVPESPPADSPPRLPAPPESLPPPSSA